MARISSIHSRALKVMAWFPLASVEDCMYLSWMCAITSAKGCVFTIFSRSFGIRARVSLLIHGMASSAGGRFPETTGRFFCQGARCRRTYSLVGLRSSRAAASPTTPRKALVMTIVSYPST